MSKISILSIEDALYHSKERFKSLKEIECGEVLTQYSSDKYSVSYIIKYGGKDVVLKVLIDEDNERSEQYISSLNTVEQREPLFIDKLLYLPKELTVISIDNQSISSAGVVMFDIPSPSITEYTKECDGDSNLLPALATTINSIIDRGAIFDLLSYKDFRYNSNASKISISLINNAMLSHGALVANKQSTAFINFLIGSLVRASIDSYTKVEGDVSYEVMIDKFDIRRADLYLSDDYLNWLWYVMDVAKMHCEIDCSALRGVIGSVERASIIEAINHFANTNVEHSAKRFEDDRYEITGLHAESRIAFLDNETHKFGFVDYKFNIIIEPTYDSVTDFREEVSVCELEGKFGAINRIGEIIVPFDYTHLEWDIDMNRFVYSKGEEQGYFARYQ